MRVEVRIGDLQAYCDHVWVNGMLYVPNTNLVFGGTEPVEVRFRSVAANVTGDITMEYRCETVAVVFFFSFFFLSFLSWSTCMYKCETVAIVYVLLVS